MITKAQIELLNDISTIIVVPDGGIEADIVNRWLRQHAKKAEEEQRVFDALYLHHLQAGQTVVGVYRDPSTPALAYSEGPQGSIVSKPRPDSETFGELVVTAPVKVADHWVRDNPRAPGRPDLTAFKQALDTALLPKRLDYTDKGEARPQVLRMVSV